MFLILNDDFSVIIIDSTYITEEASHMWHCRSNLMSTEDWQFMLWQVKDVLKLTMDVKWPANTRKAQVSTLVEAVLMRVPRDGVFMSFIKAEYFVLIACYILKDRIHQTVYCWVGCVCSQDDWVSWLDVNYMYIYRSPTVNDSVWQSGSI